jgi:hypothetical protein
MRLPIFVGAVKAANRVSRLDTILVMNWPAGQNSSLRAIIVEPRSKSPVGNQRSSSIPVETELINKYLLLFTSALPDGVLTRCCVLFPADNRPLLAVQKALNCDDEEVRSRRNDGTHAFVS